MRIQDYTINATNYSLNNLKWLRTTFVLEGRKKRETKENNLS